MKVFLVNGVPRSVQQDGWWMSADVPRRPRPPSSSAAAGKPDVGSARLAALAALVALADILIWQVTPGISLGVFFLALLGVAMLLLGKSLTFGRAGAALAMAGLSLIPLIEQVQALSVMIAALGVGAAAVVGTVGMSNAATGVLRLWQAVPLLGLRHAGAGAKQIARQTDVAATAEQMALRWALPLGFGLAFLGLLAEANPMLETWLTNTTNFTFHGPGVGRVLFWLGVALLIWPLLVLAELRQRLLSPFTGSVAVVARPALINAGAVARSLVLFNALFAVQSGMDLFYLWAGATLPTGMSYAEYAHRGAYPLVATAILAGVFALMSRPLTTSNTALRYALLAFVAQNVFLVCSSLFRLDLYVDVYGLTRLRLAAFVWMALVGAGLCMITWQVVARHKNGWLMKRLAVVGVATIYGVTLFSFDASIAKYNLTHNVPLDRVYLCRLGPAALPAIQTFESKTGEILCMTLESPRVPEFSDWREWGFRDWRVLRSLSQMQFPDTAP